MTDPDTMARESVEGTAPRNQPRQSHPADDADVWADLTRAEHFDRAFEPEFQAKRMAQRYGR